MSMNRIDIAARNSNGTFTVEEMPERFRMTQRDLDDLQRDMEPILRSAPTGSGSLGAYGSYRRHRWD